MKTLPRLKVVLLLGAVTLSSGTLASNAVSAAPQRTGNSCVVRQACIRDALHALHADVLVRAGRVTVVTTTRALVLALEHGLVRRDATANAPTRAR